MGSLMKTTIDIADPLLEEAKAMARRDGVTLRELVERGLHLVLAQRDQPRFVLEDGAFKGEGKGLTPEAEAAGWDEIRAWIYEGRGG